MRRMSISFTKHDGRIKRKNFIPPREARAYVTNKTEREWAQLYVDGWTIQRIVNEYTGTYRVSYGTVRRSLVEQGVTLRKPGGRGSLGLSPIVRLAELEMRVKEIALGLVERDRAIDFLASQVRDLYDKKG